MVSATTSSSKEYGYGSINTDFEVVPEAKKRKDIIGCDKLFFSSGGTRRIAVGAVVGVAIFLIGSKTFFPPNPRENSIHGIRIHSKSNSKSNSNSNYGGSPSSPDDKNDPFRLSPVENMGMLSVERNDDALPSPIWGNHLYKEGHPLPTNSWYLNLVSHRAASAPDDSTRVYTVPYIVDTASPFPGMEGLRVHWPVVKGSDTNVQMVNDFTNSLCLGAVGFGTTSSSEDGENQIDGSYRVTDGPLSHLGVGLEWGAENNSNSSSSSGNIMSTNIIRGMPYATMKYDTSFKTVPMIYSYHGMASDVQFDRTTPFKPIKSKSPKLVCGIEGTSKKGNVVTVQSHLHLHMVNSDFTWMVFFNKPVGVSCETNQELDPNLHDFKMAILDSDNSENNTTDADGDDAGTEKTDLIVRVAILNQCTTGHSTMPEHCMEQNALEDPEEYEFLLKQSAHLIPQSPTIDFEYSTKPDNTNAGNVDDVANIIIDWDAASTKKSTDEIDEQADLLMFALPHHQESLSSADASIPDANTTTTHQCISSFHGKTCLVSGSKWILEEDLGSPLSFDAPRPPMAEFIPTIAEYLSDDIHFKLPRNTMRGASDTYFSGKIIARLARIIVIASELRTLASASSIEDIQGLYQIDSDASITMLQDSMEAASSVDLPSSEDIALAVDQLRTVVQVWLKSDADAPYIYDKTWGGLVNCGCIYVGKKDKGSCNNTFPDCPALLSVNEDFGNGYYNDHHYHYGYHVYAAAVVAKFDPSWGRKHFDEVLLYIRDFANPYGDDEFFPQYRQKDWFLGSSWASGIISAENSPHGRNEESSSEAISAYEGMTLFGTAMVDAFEQVKNGRHDEIVATKLEKARLIRDSGQLLTASEIHATNRYWHLWSSDTHNNTYPPTYTQPVVGMLYDTMASFQTWFAPWAVVSFGIQLIPLTPVTETRDNVDWAIELYPKYEKACDDSGDFCEANGWSILQAGLLATAGNRSDAVKQAEAVPKEVFATDGGVGNSMTNTIWYIATRKEVV
uniref:glucan endo-1,3-beta-D-glucosidase n=1 Tax=Pseudo-nitzschia australis TaxID=44445 RepID=A0A7S4AT85_9STRA|mmetsp:Transcript_16803/g.34541  ORF Transcript_16803/g.34541 Transcript_16803/m.34541 type:complete len:1015 (-) Transcript_16803:337-3381(-)